MPKKLKLKTPQAQIEQFLEESIEPKKRNYTNSVYLTFSRKELKNLANDYNKMIKLLKKEGYKIKTVWEIGLDGTTTKNNPDKEILKRKKIKIKRKRLKL